MPMINCMMIDADGNVVSLLDQDGPFHLETRVQPPLTSMMRVQGEIHAMRTLEDEPAARAFHAQLAADLHTMAFRYR